MVTVLVVDDEPSMRTLIRRILEPAGYSVEEAGNGREALQRYRDGAFELVLTDWNMPEMGGNELIQAILTSPGLAPRFLIITGRPGEIPEDWPCLPKPFLPKDLLAKVRAVCSDASIGFREQWNVKPV